MFELKILCCNSLDVVALYMLFIACEASFAVRMKEPKTMPENPVEV